MNYPLYSFVLLLSISVCLVPCAAPNPNEMLDLKRHREKATMVPSKNLVEKIEKLENGLALTGVLVGHVMVTHGYPGNDDTSIIYRKFDLPTPSVKKAEPNIEYALLGSWPTIYRDARILNYKTYQRCIEKEPDHVLVVNAETKFSLNRFFPHEITNEPFESLCVYEKLTQGNSIGRRASAYVPLGKALQTMNLAQFILYCEQRTAPDVAARGRTIDPNAAQYLQGFLFDLSQTITATPLSASELFDLKPTPDYEVNISLKNRKDNINYGPCDGYLALTKLRSGYLHPNSAFDRDLRFVGYHRMQLQSCRSMRPGEDRSFANLQVEDSSAKVFNN